MAEEKIVVLNLRKYLVRKPAWQRKGYALRFIRDLLQKKTKAKKVTLTTELNEKIWKNFDKIKIKIVKDDKTVKADVVE